MNPENTYHRDRVAKHKSHYQADEISTAPKRVKVQSRRGLRAANKAAVRRLLHDMQAT